MSFEINRVSLVRNGPVLVTGGWGMLGKALRQELARQGFTNILSPRRAELDLLDAAATFAYLRQHRPIYVFHLASVVFGLLGNLRNQVKAISENTLLNHNVLMACA